MQHQQLGRSGLRVSRVALGTMNLGPLVDELDARRLLDRAVALGVTLVDTANVYGADVDRNVFTRPAGKGTTEVMLGRWLAANAGRRDQVILATKAFGVMGDGPNDRGLSARHLRRACDASLRRLQTDHIDLYQLHHVDRSTPWEEIWDALDVLRHQGKVLYVGTSNHAAWQLVQGQEASRARGRLGIVSEQSPYSLVNRTVELEVLPASHAYGIGFLAYAPLVGGALAGADGNGARRHSGRAAATRSTHHHQLAAFQSICQGRGQEPAGVALAWVLSRRGVTAAVLGIRTEEQLESAVAACDITLDDDELRQLDELFPGPGGPAPEAYAW
ncbi:MAG TPA: aldo/keto reductase [Pseudonocardiaceae bacterium]|nr:aldo/keto reductase [Pseudonocardiaceae bacterium]